MKKITIIVFLLTICFISYSQTPKPFVNPRSSNSITVQDYNLSVPGNLYIPRLNDTTSSNSIDSIGNLIYDRIRAKVWIRDTVLTGGHKWNTIGENIANSSLTANGTYSQNWNNKQLWIDSISGAFQIRTGGIGSSGTRRKEFKIAWGTSFGDNLDGWRIVSVVRNAVSTTDSIYLGMVSGGTGVLSAGVFNTILGNNFISYNTSGLININAKDSIWLRGATPAANADTILGLEDRGNGLGKLKKIPFPAATSLNNIGSGYRWVATSGGNIKTVSPSNTILLDSTSNSNSLTAKVDTSTISTKYYVNNGGVTYPLEDTIGLIYERNQWDGGTMAAEFTNVNGTTIALNGSYPRSTSSTVDWGTYHRFLPNRPTLLPKWSFTVEFQIVSAFASNIGFGPSLRSNNVNGANFGYASYLACFSSTGTPHLAKQDGTNDQTNGSFTISQGDVIRMTLAFNDSVLTLISQNLTTSSAIITVTKSFVAGTAPYVPNTGTLGFQNFSGTYEIRYIKFSSNATSTPTLAIAADSKGQIITTTFGGRFPSQLNANYPTVLQYSGSGDQLKDFIDKKEEVMRINPEQWWILLGSNDLRYGNSLATTMSRVRQVKSWFTGTSTRVYWSVIPEDSTGGPSGGGIGMSNFKAALQAEAGSDYIDLWTDMSTSNVLKTIYNGGDGVHPNQAGHNEVYTLSVASNKITTISPNRRSEYQKFGGGIAPIGDSLTTIYTLERAANNIPRFDDSLNIKPSFIYNDASKIMMSSNLTQATHFSGAFLDVDGMIAMGGNAASFVYRDRTNVNNFHSQYSNVNLFRFNYNGADHSSIDANGKWSFGFDINKTTIFGTVRILKSYVLSGTQSVLGYALNIDTSSFTNNQTGALGNGAVSSIAPMTFIGAGGGSSYTNLSTFYVDGAPIAGANMTISNPWSLYIKGGNSYFGNTLSLNNITNPPSTYNILVHGLTDSATYQLPAASLGGSGTNGQYLTLISGSPAWTGGRNAQSGTTYTVLSTDVYKIIGLTNTAARTITLPAASAFPAGVTVWFKDEAGTAGTGNIVINRAGSDTIDGATSYTISTNYGFIGLYSDGSSKWFVR